ncbi:synaptic vesicle glycoprotein 2B [Plutella xylostella]|uniref:synaptic vesicle glycoprotein 2B n=1 Tax=Plutella xylostella TaxID=51655 RepID=UPI0020326D46|nr:synaptic vesicle glycoprotein 2B [Plutella xylostella]
MKKSYNVTTVKTISGKVDESESAGHDLNNVSYDDAVEYTGNGPYSYLLLAACSMISHAVSLDLFGFGVIVAASACDLRLTMAQKGLLSSIPFAGIIFAFPWGYYADTAGRRRALVLSTAVGFLFAALSSLANQWYTMVACKFIGCSFSTASFSITMTMLGECTGRRQRGRYLQIMNSINLASEAVSFLLALYILPLHITFTIPGLGITYHSWRLLTLVMALPMGAGALLMLYLHESPKFLASVGDEVEAMRVLRSMYERNGGVKGEYPVKSILITSPSSKDSKESFCSSMADQTLPLFKPPLLIRTAQLFYLLLIICSTNNVFVMWFPSIVNSFFLSLNNSTQSGLDMSFCHRVMENPAHAHFEETTICTDTISHHTIYCGIAYGVFFLLLNLAISTVSKHRRVVMVSTLVVSAVSCVLVDLVREPVSNMIFFVLLQSTSILLGIAGSYFVDMFPTKHRALATSLGMMIGRVGSFAGVNLVGATIARYCNTIFYSWSVFVASGILVTLYLPSDNKVNSLGLNKS